MRLLLAAITLSLAVVLLASATARAADRLPVGWEKGFNYTQWWHDAYATASAETALDRLAATGANSVALIPTWYMESAESTRIAPDPLRSPSDASIATAVRRAQARGLRVFLRPLVDLQDGGGRSHFRPSHVDDWFASYRAMLWHYASLAESLKVETLSVGAEYSSLDSSGQDAQWRRVIAGARRRFSGELTYGANWDAYRRVTFWDVLDSIGIDAYFPLANGRTPGTETILGRWRGYTDGSGRRHSYVDDLAALAARWDKPVRFHEVGYASTGLNLHQPWSNAGGRYDGGAQARALDAMLRAFKGRRWFRGVFVWHWVAHATAGGTGDTDHRVQGKPAEAALGRWFRRAAAKPHPPITRSGSATRLARVCRRLRIAPGARRSGSVRRCPAAPAHGSRRR